MHFGRLNTDTDPLTAAVPNLAELLTAIQKKPHPIMSTTDVKDMFFMVPFQTEDRSFYIYMRRSAIHFYLLPQGFNHSPTLAHHTLAQDVEKIPKADSVAVCYYIDGILGGRAWIRGKRGKPIEYNLLFGEFGFADTPRKDPKALTRSSWEFGGKGK